MESVDNKITTTKIFVRLSTRQSTKAKGCGTNETEGGQTIDLVS
jgi:hypothetical protein